MAAILTELAQFFAAARLPEGGRAYLVGGFLRDALRESGRSTTDGSPAAHDLDLAVPLLGAALQNLARELADQLTGAYVALSPARNVARIVVNANAPATPPSIIDLAGFPGGWFHGDDLTAIHEDLQRRDFTVNALALPLEEWRPGPVSDWADRIIDPCNGRADLAQKLIRAVHPEVFRHDPGRLLRGVRLAGQLQFRLEPETARQIRAEAPLLARVSPERVRDELLQILAADQARPQLEVLDRLDLLCRIIPELALTKGVEQPRAYHYWDVWQHLLHTVEYAEQITRGHQHSAIYTLSPWTAATAAHFAPATDGSPSRRALLKLAALLHDIAKPQTRSVDDAGRIRFFGHSEQGAAMARERLTQLRLPSRSIALVSKMVELHLRPAQLRQGEGMPSRRAIYRYFRDAGDAAIDTIYLALADYLAARGPELEATAWAHHAAMLTYVLQTGTGQIANRPAAGPPRLLNGNDLMRHFGLSPGPQIGRLLAELAEAQAIGEITTAAAALERAAALLAADERQSDPESASEVLQ